MSLQTIRTDQLHESGAKVGLDAYSLGWAELECHCDGILAECNSVCATNQRENHSQGIDARDIESLVDAESIESQNDLTAS